MILVDDRKDEGKRLYPLFPKGKAVKERLPVGDFTFGGNGPNGRISIAIERKTLPDMLTSMRDNRLAGFQLVRMLRVNVRVLLIEGIYTTDRHGFIMVPRKGKGLIAYRARSHTGAFHYSELNKFLVALRMQTAVWVIRTSNRYETVHTVLDMYHYFQKPWEKHRSLFVNYKLAHPPRTTRKKKGEPIVWFRRPNLVASVAAEVGKIRWVKGERLAQRFKSVVDLVNASVEELQEVEGIGPVLANRIYNNFRKRFYTSRESVRVATVESRGKG